MTFDLYPEPYSQWSTINRRPTFEPCNVDVQIRIACWLNSLFLIEHRIEHRTALFERDEKRGGKRNEKKEEVYKWRRESGYCLDLRTYKDTGGLSARWERQGKLHVGYPAGSLCRESFQGCNGMLPWKKKKEKKKKTNCWKNVWFLFFLRGHSLNVSFEYSRKNYK